MSSDTEKLAIATNFMLAAPPGEFNEVVTDVRALVANDTLLNKSALDTFRKYNSEQMLTADHPSAGYKLLITSYGEIDKKTYQDPRSGEQFQFDHVKHEVSNVTSGNFRGKNEALRSSLDNLLVDYLAEYYPDGAAAVYDKGSQLVACISASRFSPNNYWNGRLRSTWTLELSSGQLTGHVRALVHYYEEGNVQLDASSDQFKTKVDKADEGTMAADIFKFIQQSEAIWQEGVDDTYLNMNETMRAMRRQLPMTRQKLDWVKIYHGAARVADELGGK